MFKGPIALSTIRTSFVLGLRLLIQAGTLLLVARMLGPEEFGFFAGVAALAVLMGTFSTFGTHLVLLSEVSKDKKRCDHILGYAVPTTLICGSFLFLGYLVLCLLLFQNIPLPLQVIVCIGLTESILLPLFLLLATEDLALGKTARSQLLIILPLGLRTLAAAVVLAMAPEQPLSVFAWWYLFTAMLALVFMKVYKADAWPKLRQWKLASKQELKHSAGYATLALTAAGPSELDKMLAVKLLPLGVSGLYVAASRVIGAATLPVTALLLAALPKLFRHGAESTVQTQRLNRWMLGSVFFYGVALAGILWFLAPLVQWMFGPAYAGIEQMLRWLCLAVPGLALRITITTSLMTLGKPWLRAGFEVLGMLSLAIVAVALSPRLEAIGMALALAASEWGMVVAGFLFVQKHKKLVVKRKNNGN